MNRFRIDSEYGYVELSDEARAWEMYRDPEWRSIRISLIDDRITGPHVLAGSPIVEDLTVRFGLN